MNSSTGRMKFGLVGGALGGLIAVIGYWIFSPEVHSLFVFVVLRILVGSVVASIAGPIIFSRKGKKDHD